MRRIKDLNMYYTNKRIYNILLLTLFSFSLNAQNLRDPVKWPFNKNSIWNTPIGSEAVYKDAGFEAAAHVGVDVGHIIISDYTYNEYQVLNSPTWGPGRCTGTTYLGFDLKVPDSWTVPDAGNSPYGLTPNSAYSYISPDRQKVEQGGKISRCIAEGPVYLPEWKKWPNNRKYVDLRGDGLGNQGQGASGMSTIGGTIRLGEFTGEEPIRHVIKINPWAAKYCHYSEEIPGWKWPAVRADNYAAEKYNRNADPDIVMGSLFAIPPHLTPDSLGIQTDPGRKLFHVLQDYGAYFTEDAAWDVWDIIVERDVEIEFEQEYGFSMKSSTWLSEVNKLMQAIHVVLNNTPESIGGGGVRRANLAPDFIESCQFTITTNVEEGVEIAPLGMKTLNINSSTLLTVKAFPENYLFTRWEILEGSAEIENSTDLTTRMKVLSDSVIVLANFEEDPNYQEPRDPYKWPFSKTSIWNMPIGSDARYIHAGIERAEARGMTIDEDIIVTKPGEQLMAVYENYAGWNRNKDRCPVEGPFMFAAPIPSDFIVSPQTWDGLTPNSGLAAVMPDGRTIKQTQPFAHCSEGLQATSRYTSGDTDIYGSGYFGMHGGSALSAIGGALRLGELMPGSGPIRHALKVNLFGKKNYYYDSETQGYRWPAKRADSYASGNYGTERTSPIVEECRMGALLALPPSMNLDSLGFETEPARRLAETFRDYGAYVVDDTGWDVYAIITEWSPDGNYADEFEKQWGFSMKEGDKDSPWARDMDRIFLNLHVVDNNGPDSIGGGGEPRMPLAPDFLPTVNINLETDGATGVAFTRPKGFRASTGTSTKIMISKVPDGYSFINWVVLEGNVVVENPEEVETMVQVNDEDSRIRANFDINSYELSISTSGEGGVSVDPEDISFEYGTDVTLSATAEEGWEFAGWDGDLVGYENPAVFTITEQSSITAIFDPLVSNSNLFSEEKSIILNYDPMNQELNLVFNAKTRKVSISLIDILGKQHISSESNNPELVTLSTSELPKGIFMVRIWDEEGNVAIRRFVR